jgi:tetratricopeptide (TPR) repeat protein
MVNATARFATLAALLLASGLAGCATSRPTEDIRASAERAVKLGDWETAAGEYELIIDRYPGDWRAQYGLGRSALQLERWAQARQALSVAHNLQPRDEVVADALAEAIFRQGDDNGLYVFLREQVDRTRSVHAYGRLAHYALEMGDVDTAKVAHDTAIELDGAASVEPYLAAAEFAQRVGDLDEAVRRLRQAHWIDPMDPRVKERLVALGEIPGPTLALPPDR